MHLSSPVSESLEDSLVILFLKVSSGREGEMAYFEGFERVLLNF